MSAKKIFCGGGRVFDGGDLFGLVEKFILCIIELPLGFKAVYCFKSNFRILASLLLRDSLNGLFCLGGRIESILRLKSCCIA